MTTITRWNITIKVDRLPRLRQIYIGGIRPVWECSGLGFMIIAPGRFEAWERWVASAMWRNAERTTAAPPVHHPAP